MFIRECMTKNPVTAEPSDTLARADAKMKAGGFRRLPVVHEGKLMGILSEYDLRGYLLSLLKIISEPEYEWLREIAIELILPRNCYGIDPVPTQNSISCEIRAPGRVRC